MQALAKVSDGHGNLELIEISEPEPEADEVLVKVAAAGVCGSDVGIYEFDQAYQFMDFPRVLGHEYSGKVIAVGDDVREYRIGDRIVERPVRACLSCYQCLTGQQHICQNAIIPGVHVQGAYAPLIAAPAESLVQIPDGLSIRDAAITEPVGVAVRAVTRNSRITAGDSVLVQGPGPIGLLSAIMARRQGGDVVISGIDADSSYRLPNAAEHGLETVNASRESVAESGPDRGYDVVIDATGHPSGLQTAAKVVLKGGQVVVIGQAGIAEVDVSAFVRAEVDVQFTYSAAYRDFERALDLLETSQIDPNSIIDRFASLDEAGEVFEAVAGGGLCKPVFELKPT